MKSCITTKIFSKKIFENEKEKWTSSKSNSCTFQKEKEVLSSTLTNTQKDFDAHKVSCKAKLSIIDENEISVGPKAYHSSFDDDQLM